MVLSATQLIVFASESLYREAWCALLSRQPYIQVVGATHYVAEVKSFLSTNQPTTILIDVSTPTPALAHQLRIVTSNWGLLFLVHTHDLAEVIALVQAGATGCISRDDSVGELVRAIIAAGRGEVVLPPSMAANILASLAHTARALATLTQNQAVTETMVEALSERETDILSLLGQGMTNKDIAQTLIISVRTVEAHLRSIFDKLGVHSRTEAALLAARLGYGQLRGNSAIQNR
jgi:DNA-binding NarL/FixJ family response regulator